MDTAAPDPTDPEIAAKISLATGGAAPTHAWHMMAALADAAGGAAGTGDGGDKGDAAGGARVVAALEAAIALAPRDPLEGMLAVQMAAVHAAALRCLARAAACAEHPQIEALYLRQAARLLNLFVRQAEALDRRARRLGRGDGSRHAQPSAGPTPGARHLVHEPMPMAARGPGEESCDPADETGAEPEADGAEILRTLIADIYANRREADGAAGRGAPSGASGTGGRDPDPGGGPAPGGTMAANRRSAAATCGVLFRLVSTGKPPDGVYRKVAGWEQRSGMPHRYRIDSSFGLLIDRFEGKLAWHEVLGGILSSADDPDFRPGMDVLADLTAADLDIRFESARMMADRVSNVPAMRYGRIAVVAPESLQFGVARMFGSLLDGRGIAADYRVFRGFSQARDWLELPTDLKLPI